MNTTTEKSTTAENMMIDGDALATLYVILADICGAGTLESARESAEAAIRLIDDEVADLCPADGRTTYFQTGPDAEKDTVCVEVLLMKLALAESVINDMARYIEESEKGYGTVPEGVTGPSDWAIAGVSQNLMEVSHALTCGCWGYLEAFKH